MFRSIPESARRGEDGFTLIEVLCASVVAALAIGLVLQLVSGMLRASHRLDDQLAARVLAQSLLTAARDDKQMSAGHKSGLDGKFAWRVDVTPAALQPASAWRLYRLNVVVSWGRQSDIVLTTMRLVR